jgi:hypothetical protein
MAHPDQPMAIFCLLRVEKYLIGSDRGAMVEPAEEITPKL